MDRVPLTLPFQNLLFHVAKCVSYRVLLSAGIWYASAQRHPARKRPGGLEVKAKIRILIPIVAAFFAFSNVSWAHHASRQVYEGKSIMLMGVVTDYEWANPHSVLSIAVKDNKGKVEEWHAEILPPSEMLRAGWTKESLKPGDEVTLTGRPGKYEQHIMWLEYLVMSDGTKLGRKP
jgi:Family of unknown function (DUF6152)